MKPSEVLQSHRADIRRIVAQNHTKNPRIFDSAVNGKDTDASDLDLLVDTTSDTTLLDIARIQDIHAAESFAADYLANDEVVFG